MRQSAQLLMTLARRGIAIIMIYIRSTSNKKRRVDSAGARPSHREYSRSSRRTSTWQVVFSRPRPTHAWSTLTLSCIARTVTLRSQLLLVKRLPANKHVRPIYAKDRRIYATEKTRLNSPNHLIILTVGLRPRVHYPARVSAGAALHPFVISAAPPRPSTRRSRSRACARHTHTQLDTQLA